MKSSVLYIIYNYEVMFAQESLLTTKHMLVYHLVCSGILFSTSTLTWNISLWEFYLVQFTACKNWYRWISQYEWKLFKSNSLLGLHLFYVISIWLLPVRILFTSLLFHIRNILLLKLVTVHLQQIMITVFLRRWEQGHNIS